MLAGCLCENRYVLIYDILIRNFPEFFEFIFSLYWVIFEENEEFLMFRYVLRSSVHSELSENLEIGLRERTF